MKKTQIIIAACAVIAISSAIYFLSRTESSERKYAYIPSALVDAPSLIGEDGLRENGIEPVAFVTGKETAQALMGGSTFVSTLAEWPFLLATNKREDLRVIAVLTKAHSLGILVNKESGITSIEEMKGKKIGFPQGTSAQYLYESYLSEHDLLNDVTSVSLAPPQLGPALERGDIDGMVIWQPFLEKARLSNKKDYYYLKGSQTFTKVIYCAVSTEENIKKDPEGIKLVLESLIDAEEKINAADEATIAKIQKSSGLSKETVEELLPLFEFRVSLDSDLIETWKKLADWAHKSGLVDEKTLSKDWKKYLHTETLKSIDSSRVKL